MPELFEVYQDAVENLDWNFGLMCSFAGVDEGEATQDLGCQCPYGLLGMLEVDWGISDLDPEDF